MIIRIVQMAFKPEESEKFLTLYRKVEPHIKAFEGCASVELLEDLSEPHAYATYSLWHRADDLERYRASDLFAATWKEVKRMLRQKAVATSYRKL
ncbi:MAG: antibiotic biosynthesis monooxygenase [Rhizobacter sp.]|nr:antibiotic biosynthesis monooxygenase [Chlorobiales bacterium]